MNENNNTGSEIQDTERQPTQPDALGSQGKGEQEGRARPVVRFTGLRRRLLDADNFAAGIKGLLDSLVHSGLIPNDSPKDIDAQFSQFKVGKQDEEKTIVQITYP